MTSERFRQARVRGKEREQIERMPLSRVVSGALEDGLRREWVYGGDLLVFDDLPPLKEFCAFTDATIREAFGAADPARMQLEPDGHGYLCFSVGALTVDAGDAANGRGGPNADGEAPRAASDRFRRVDDTPLMAVAAKG